jgi:hypothetical protein
MVDSMVLKGRLTDATCDDWVIAARSNPQIRFAA